MTQNYTAVGDMQYMEMKNGQLVVAPRIKVTAGQPEC